ncbi:MAG: SCP2 sterol-binding domain-containing protein [Actinomycetota bacterium]
MTPSSWRRQKERCGRPRKSRAGCPDGTTIAFEVSGPAGFVTLVTVSGGRGKVVEATDSDGQGFIRMDQETFLCLTTGRWEPEAALDDGRVSLAGDEEAARRVVLALNFMF